MITESDSMNTVDLGRYYAILPSAGAYSLAEYCERMNGSRVEPGFSYNSGRNTDFLSVERLGELVAEYVAEQTRP